MIPSLSKLRFEEEGHKYFYGDKRVPGVTDVLKTVGLSKDWKGVDPFYRDRGKAGHKCIELFLKNELDEGSIDPILTPFFDGFRRYWDQHASTPLAIEVVRYNPELEFAGTIDMVTEDAIIDWKFSKSHDRVAELQGEAYKILESRVCPFKVVQFPGDGTFEVFDYGRAIDTWPHVMEIYRWKKGK